jgi:serine/threonine-protein kinase
MTTASEMTLEAGIVLRDTYVIEGKLATGGMGEVYVARHVRLPGRFAVKVLSSRLLRDQDAVARFCREASIVSMIRHPHVVGVFDFDVTAEGMPFLVMECVEGKDLARHILDHGPMSPRRTAHIVQQVAAALEAAHRRGIVHRDLKPANVMLLEGEGLEDFVKVLDFGVSKVRGMEPGISGQWKMLGTPSYMAPEQAEGRLEAIDGRADQFALAVLAYVLLTGSDPFPGTTTGEVLTKILHADPEPMAGKLPCSAPGIARIERVIGRALSKRPEDRYARVLEFAEALAVAIAGLSESERQQARDRGRAEVSVSGSLSDLSTVVRLFPPRFPPVAPGDPLDQPTMVRTRVGDPDSPGPPLVSAA